MLLMQLSLGGYRLIKVWLKPLAIHMVDLNNRVLVVNFHLKVCLIASLKEKILV